MRWLRGPVWLGVLALAWCQAPAAAPAQKAGADVKLQVVNYDQLGDLIRANQGKVIVVDFWALTCGPCKRNFPHVVEMYKKYKDRGLVVISAATDDIRENPKTQERILKFLNDNEAVTTNVVVDEPTEVIVKKLRVTLLPCMYVFDRDGKWRQLIGDTLVDGEGEIRHAEVEGLVKKLLDAK
jgi:thiol-disulfide isomerase/thioredoxin